MPLAIRIPKITWGTSFANTLELGYPLDEAVPMPKLREGSAFTTGPDGGSDSYIVGVDHLLKGAARWIPPTDETTPHGVPITGWDGATGWDALLQWLWAKNIGRWFPDRTSGTFQPFYLEEPMDPSSIEREAHWGYKRVGLTLRTSDGSAFTGY